MALSFWNSAAFLFSGRGSEVLADRGSSGTFLNTQIKMIYDCSRHGLSEAAELLHFRGKHLCAVWGGGESGLQSWMDQLRETVEFSDPQEFLQLKKGWAAMITLGFWSPDSQH